MYVKLEFDGNIFNFSMYTHNFWCLIGRKKYQLSPSDQIGKTRSKSAMKLKEKPKGLSDLHYNHLLGFFYNFKLGKNAERHIQDTCLN